MSEWKSLGEVCDFSKDKVAISVLDLGNYISTENLLPNKGGVTEAASLPKIVTTTSFNVGDILISNIRPYFKKIWRAKFSGGCSNDVLVIRAKKNVEPRFLYYVLSEDKFFDLVTVTAKGTKMPRGDKQVIMNYPVPNFPLETQKKISAVLSALDDKIELNNAINKNLEEQAQAIFKSWFIDFEPFGGTMPDDWLIEEFQSLLTERREKSNNPKLKLFSVTDSGILPREEKFKKKLSKPTTINKVIYQGDLVFGMSRKILNWGVMRECIGAVSSAYNIFLVSEKVNSKYLESFIKQNIIYFHDLIRPASREGQGLDKGILMRKKIYLPDDETLKRYYEVEDSLTTTVNVIRQENQKLGELRDVLLPRLMSGEIDVSKVEIFNEQ